ncbi:DUF3306 domain-containing protein [Tropicibacter sp. R16_0]|uniref:DUF3306 domain-containing protein n=1 Tax=Tropicibacter sp. R16_0 TaxID=2821102 RepID=UPI001AD9F7A1|nr:DUF3306 domain-containing protein [Tropicibacter sp. R16_0]MBO9452083.1 DUF3306 domain-containing protein [Tropicibacter sp. R16_0]
MTQARDFWSKRKAAVQAEAEAEEAALALQQEDAELDADERSDAEILTELNLPDPDTLKMGDDVTGFMAKAVPDRLRRRALRRLWRLNPVLANVDGLVDYGEDYTDAACVVENLQTAYQVGKGMLAHVEALAKADEDPEDQEPTVEDLDVDTAPSLPDPDEPEPLAALKEDAPASDAGDEVTPSGVGEEPAPTVHDPALHSPTPRRMRFEFEG